MKVLKRCPVVTDVDKLHQLSSDVPIGDVKLQNELRDSLLRTFRDLNGAAKGLAAIQCDRPYKAVLLRFVKGEDPIIIFNPRVLFKMGSKKSNEGCISEGDIRYIVHRPLVIIARFYDGNKIITRVYGYKKARVFMHEYDHLYGILLQDKGKRVEV